MKSIAILMVISLHIPLWKYNFFADGLKEFDLYPQFCFRLVSEGVPIFFLVNGYLLFSHPYSWKKHKKKIQKVLLFFVVWVVIQNINQCLVRKTELSLTSIVKHIITMDYTSTLWFYKTLFFVYLIFPAVKMVYDADKGLFRFLFYTLTFFTVSIHFFEGFNYFLDSREIEWLKGINNFLSDFYPVGARGTASMMFFMAGGRLSDCEEKIKEKRYLWIAIGAGAWIFEIAWYTYLSNLRGVTHAFFWFGNLAELLFCIGVFAASLTFKYGKICTNVLQTVSENTNGIYLLHTMLMSRIISPFSSDFLGRFAYLFFLCGISLVISIILSRIPYVKKLIKF